jgi:hypothetical protein
MDAGVATSLPQLDDGDKLFKYTVLALSTLNPQDPNLLRFFRQYKIVFTSVKNIALLKDMASALREVPPRQFILFYFILFILFLVKTLRPPLNLLPSFHPSPPPPLSAYPPPILTPPQAITGLQNLTTTVVEYFPVVVNQLLLIMVKINQIESKSNPTPSRDAPPLWSGLYADIMETLLHLLSRVGEVLDDRAARPHVVAAYVDYFFDNLALRYSNVHILLVFGCSVLLKHNSQRRRQLFLSAWFFFDLIVKSIVLEAKRSGAAAVDATVISDLKGLLCHMVEEAHLEDPVVLASLLRYAALFLVDLFPVFGRDPFLHTLHATLVRIWRADIPPARAERVVKARVEFMQVPPPLLF